MIFELIAALSAGFGVFGLVLIANRLLGQRLPGWAYPAAFGLGMLGYSVWSETTWANRSLTAAPHAVLVEAPTGRMAFQPLSWLIPQVTHMIVLDRRFLRVNPAAPDLVLVRVARLARFLPETGFLAVFDCAGARIAPLADGADFAPDGTLPGAAWADLPADDPMLTGACDLREDARNGDRQGA